MSPPDFDLQSFTPYLLNRAAETTSLEFQAHYRARYGMLRTEWRVLFHLGSHGALTARDICDRARLHKTKVSRAVAALEAKRFLARHRRAEDRRQENLALTRAGRGAFEDLCEVAGAFDARLMKAFSARERQILRRRLTRLAGLPAA